MTIKFQDLTSRNAKKNLGSYGNPIGEYGSVQIMFLCRDESGKWATFCRESGTHHGFNTYESALAWIERVQHTAHKAVEAFSVEIWP